VRVPKGSLRLCLSTEYPAKEPFTLQVGYREEFDALEPNDARDQARPLALPAEASVALWPEGDRDWLALDVEKKGYVSVELPEGLTDEVEPAVSLWTGTGVRGTLRPLPTVFRADPGRVTLELRSLGNRAAASLFRVRFSFAPEIDPTEENDRPESAARVTCPGTQRFALWPPDDVDFFRVPVEKNGFLDLRVTGGPPEARLEFFFPEGAARERPQFGRQAVVRAEAGEVVVRVRSVTPLAEPAALDLRVQLSRTGDPGEPNDTQEQATPLEPGVWRVLSINPAGDKDYFSLTVGEAGTYEVQARGPWVPDWLRVNVSRSSGGRVAKGLRPGDRFSLSAGSFIVVAYGEGADASVFRLRVRRVP
jgi:hypothetical protein